MNLSDKKLIISEIINCKIIAINRVDRILEFVYIKDDKQKYITIEFCGTTGSMGRHYFFNILVKKAEDTAKNYCFSLGGEVLYKKEYVKILKDIQTIKTIKYTKNEDFEYSSEIIKIDFISNANTYTTVEFYSDDEDSYIKIDDILYTYYNSLKNGLVWEN